MLGDFTIQHYAVRNPQDLGDTIAAAAKGWFINFKTYQNIDTAVYYLNKLPEINPNLGVNFRGRPSFYEGVNHIIYSSRVKIWPQPSCNEVFIQGEALPIDNIIVYDPLRRRITLPTRPIANDKISINVSSLPQGVCCFNFSDQFFKIVNQKFNFKSHSCL